MNLEVVFLIKSGRPTRDGVCYKIHPHDCLDKNPLGNDNNGIFILESFCSFQSIFLSKVLIL